MRDRMEHGDIDILMVLLKLLFLIMEKLFQKSINMEKKYQPSKAS
jgi:hypothetical protein